MNYKNLLKEQLLSEIMTNTQPIKPYKIIIDPSKRKITRVDLENNETPSVKKGPDGNIISKLRNLKFQPSKGEQEMIRPSGRSPYRPLRYGDRGPNPFGRLRYGDSGRPSYDPTDIENSLERQRQYQRERRSHILRGRIRREFNQSDLGTQPQKPYKKKFDLSLGFRKQNPDRTIY
jgi:hypothetical protein